jgi:5,10-methylenetetrahydromethanopterin reductase
VKISSAFSTSLETPEHVATAERLGYAGAWLYDTPQQSPDIWMILALAAERTERITLGPGVLVPGLRHPMVNAAGTATLDALAPGRVAVAFGTGFSATRAMGAKSATWSYVRDYVTAFRGLLRGETVEWQGARIRMLHPAGHAPARPINVPVLISALGPVGRAVADELGDGLFTVNGDTRFAHDFSRAALALHGTVLADGEALDSPRVLAAAGPGNALVYHAAYEHGGDVEALPGGRAWLDAVAMTDETERHLVVHDQHLVALNKADLAAWGAGSWAGVTETTFTGSPAELRRRFQTVAEQGITELVYQPTGPDIKGELAGFIDIAKEFSNG